MKNKKQKFKLKRWQRVTLLVSCLLALSSCIQKQNFSYNENGSPDEQSKKPFTLVFRDRKSGEITLDVTPEVAEKLTLSATKRERAERMKILGPLVEEGKLTREDMYALYECGFLSLERISIGIAANKIVNNFPNPPDFTGKVLHHDFAAACDKDFISVGIEINSPENLRVVDVDAHNKLHRNLGRGKPDIYVYQWQQLFEANSDASVFEMRMKIDELKDYLLPQVDAFFENGTPIKWRYEP